MTVRVGTAIEFTRHARERYRERVGPQFGDAHLSGVLAAVAGHGVLTTRPPRWFVDRAKEASALYLVTGDIVFPLLEHPDGGISQLARERRNRNRAINRREANRRQR